MPGHPGGGRRVRSHDLSQVLHARREPGERADYTSSPRHGWNSRVRLGGSGRVGSTSSLWSLDRADLNGYAAYLTSHSSFKTGVYSAPDIWSSFFTGRCVDPLHLPWTYEPVPANVTRRLTAARPATTDLRPLPPARPRKCPARGCCPGPAKAAGSGCDGPVRRAVRGRAGRGRGPGPGWPGPCWPGPCWPGPCWPEPGPRCARRPARPGGAGRGRSRARRARAGGRGLGLRTGSRRGPGSGWPRWLPPR